MAALTLDLRKHSGLTPADDIAPQTIIDCGNFSTVPSDPGTLISKGHAKFTFVREHYFGPLSSCPVLFFVFSPGEKLLTLSLLQDWLNTRNEKAETHVSHTAVRGGSWSTDSSCSLLFVNLQGVVIPIACKLPHLFFPVACLLMCLDWALWTANLFSNGILCLALLVQGFKGCLLDSCQVSGLPHDCVAYRTRLRDYLRAFAGVLIKWAD